MITATSRYAGNRVALVTNPAGITRTTILHQGETGWSFTYSEYSWTSMDRVDLLAHRYYGDPTLWWIIARANPEIMDWHVLPPGYVVRVPDLTG